MGDIQTKNRAATAFRIAGIEALDYYHGEIDSIREETDSAIRKDRAKQILNQSDEDRRAVIQASKSLRLQASVFDAAAKVFESAEEEYDVPALDSEVGQLLLRADELRALAEELDLD